MKIKRHAPLFLLLMCTTTFCPQNRLGPRSPQGYLVDRQSLFTSNAPQQTGGLANPMNLPPPFVPFSQTGIGQVLVGAQFFVTLYFVWNIGSYLKPGF